MTNWSRLKDSLRGLGAHSAHPNRGLREASPEFRRDVLLSILLGSYMTRAWHVHIRWHYSRCHPEKANSGGKKWWWPQVPGENLLQAFLSSVIPFAHVWWTGTHRGRWGSLETKSVWWWWQWPLRGFFLSFFVFVKMMSYVPNTDLQLAPIFLS